MAPSTSGQSSLDTAVGSDPSAGTVEVEEVDEVEVEVDDVGSVVVDVGSVVELDVVLVDEVLDGSTRSVVEVEIEGAVEVVCVVAGPVVGTTVVLTAT